MWDIVVAGCVWIDSIFEVVLYCQIFLRCLYCVCWSHVFVTRKRIKFAKIACIMKRNGNGFVVSKTSKIMLGLWVRKRNDSVLGVLNLKSKWSSHHICSSFLDSKRSFSQKNSEIFLLFVPKNLIKNCRFSN